MPTFEKKYIILIYNKFIIYHTKSPYFLSGFFHHLIKFKKAV